MASPLTASGLPISTPKLNIEEITKQQKYLEGIFAGYQEGIQGLADAYNIIPEGLDDKALKRIAAETAQRDYGHEPLEKRVAIATELFKKSQSGRDEALRKAELTTARAKESFVSPFEVTYTPEQVKQHQKLGEVEPTPGQLFTIAARTAIDSGDMTLASKLLEKAGSEQFELPEPIKKVFFRKVEEFKKMGPPTTQPGSIKRGFEAITQPARMVSGAVGGALEKAQALAPAEVTESTPNQRLGEAAFKALELSSFAFGPLGPLGLNISASALTGKPIAGVDVSKLSLNDVPKIGQSALDEVAKVRGKPFDTEDLIDTGLRLSTAPLGPVAGPAVGSFAKSKLTGQPQKEAAEQLVLGKDVRSPGFEYAGLSDALETAQMSYKRQAAKQAAKQLPQAPLEEKVALASKLYANFVKQDQFTASVEHPSGAQLALELGADPVNAAPVAQVVEAGVKPVLKMAAAALPDAVVETAKKAFIFRPELGDAIETAKTVGPEATAQAERLRATSLLAQEQARIIPSDEIDKLAQEHLPIIRKATKTKESQIALHEALVGRASVEDLSPELQEAYYHAKALDQATYKFGAKSKVLQTIDSESGEIVLADQLENRVPRRVKTKEGEAYFANREAHVTVEPGTEQPAIAKVQATSPASRARTHEEDFVIDSKTGQKKYLWEPNPALQYEADLKSLRSTAQKSKELQLTGQYTTDMANEMPTVGIMPMFRDIKNSRGETFDLGTLYNNPELRQKLQYRLKQKTGRAWEYVTGAEAQALALVTEDVGTNIGRVARRGYLIDSALLPRVQELLPISTHLPSVARKLRSLGYAKVLDPNGGLAGLDLWNSIADKSWRPILRMWRMGHTTAFNPAYFFFNATGAAGLHTLEFGAQSLDPMLQGPGLMAAVLGASDPSSPIRGLASKIPWTFKSGAKTNLGEVLKVLDTTSMGQQVAAKLGEFELGYGKPNLLQGAERAMRSVTQFGNLPVAKYASPAYWNTLIENYQHFVPFLAKLESFHPYHVAEALDFASKVAGNYSQLTKTMKVASDAFGFLAWQSFIGKRLVQAAIDHPENFTAFLKLRAKQTRDEGQPPWHWASTPRWARANSGPLQLPGVTTPPGLSKAFGQGERGLRTYEDPIGQGMAALMPLTKAVLGTSGATDSAQAMAGLLPIFLTEWITGQNFRTGENIPGIMDIWHSKSWSEAFRNFRDSSIGRAIFSIPERPLQAAQNVVDLYNNAQLYGESRNHQLMFKAERDWLGIQRYVGQMMGLDPAKLGIEGDDIYEKLFTKPYLVSPWKEVQREQLPAVQELQRDLKIK